MTPPRTPSAEEIARDCITRLADATKPSRGLDEDIASALGGSIRRVSRLGLNGRSPGSYRVFWPHSDLCGPGHAIPYYTKDAASRSRAIRRLEALLAQPEKEEPDA
jgi:hypothetical protein